jgi:hypothetical protein
MAAAVRARIARVARLFPLGGGVLFDGAFEQRGVYEGLREVAAELALGDVELF